MTVLRCLHVNMTDIFAVIVFAFVTLVARRALPCTANNALLEDHNRRFAT
jgi:hypothetical protein